MTSSSTLDGPAHAAAVPAANGAAPYAPPSSSQQQQNGVAHHEMRVLLYGGFSGGGIDGTILSIDPGTIFTFPASLLDGFLFDHVAAVV